LTHHFEQLVESEIITTVRDFAKAVVIDLVQDRNADELTIRRMDDEAITHLVIDAGAPVLAPGLLERLLEISAGNPRLALMATEAVKTSPNLAMLRDAGVIYEKYFEPILRSNAIFKRTVALKSMGLLSFFHSIDIEDPQDIAMLDTFGFTPDSFLDIVRELQALEFVEVHDGCVVKIAEQTLATYFFYKTFFQDRSLSFSALLHGYFPSHWWQMRDGFVPAQGIFGSEKVLNPAQEPLHAYYTSIRHIPEACQLFLNVFGRYFPNLAFGYILEHVNRLEDVPPTRRMRLS